MHAPMWLKNGLCATVAAALALGSFQYSADAADSGARATWIDQAGRFVLVNDFRNAELYGPTLAFGSACAALSILEDGERQAAQNLARSWWNGFPWDRLHVLVARAPTPDLWPLAADLRTAFMEAHAIYVRNRRDALAEEGSGFTCRPLRFADFRQEFWRRKILMLGFERIVVSIDAARSCDRFDPARCGRDIDIGVTALIDARIAMLCHLASRVDRPALCGTFVHHTGTDLEAADAALAVAADAQRRMTARAVMFKTGSEAPTIAEELAFRSRERMYRMLSKFVQFANGNRRMFESLADDTNPSPPSVPADLPVDAHFLVLADDRYLSILEGRGADFSDAIVADFLAARDRGE